MLNVTAPICFSSMLAGGAHTASSPKAIKVELSQQNYKKNLAQDSKKAQVRAPRTAPH